MVQRKSIKWSFFFLLSVISCTSFGGVDLKKETYTLLLSVNKNWEGLENEIEHTFAPSSEQELVQLHLLNVVSYLERQPLTDLSKKQIKNRSLNIAILQKYCLTGDFPINSIASYRIPIFIDSHNVHCAVGYLLKENGLENVAQEIAQKQLLSYLKDIKHPQLIPWQKSSGLSLFELALIQPTYGPGIPVCAAPSPKGWSDITLKNSRITQLFKNENERFIYGIFNTDELGLKQEIKRYSLNSHSWTSLGTEITGEIFDLVFCADQIYITVLLPDEDFPHQLLKLKENHWEEIAHFNGNVISIQTLKNKLYVLGNFRTVNDSITSNFVVVDEKTIAPFKPVNLKNTPFDHMKSSKTALFLTSNGGVYRFKNDTINYITSIKYYSYISNINLDAVEDTLFVNSPEFGGYNKYFDNREQSFYINNMLYGQDYPYRSIYFTKSKIINGKMIIAGDFKSSTLIPQINDERYLVHCEDSVSVSWFGGGLIYEYEQTHYPIIDKGVILDFIQIDEHIYILKKDGSIWHKNLVLIEGEIAQLRKRALH